MTRGAVSHVQNANLISVICAVHLPCGRCTKEAIMPHNKFHNPSMLRSSHFNRTSNLFNFSTLQTVKDPLCEKKENSADKMQVSRCQGSPGFMHEYCSKNLTMTIFLLLKSLLFERFKAYCWRITAILNISTIAK